MLQVELLHAPEEVVLVLLVQCVVVLALLLRVSVHRGARAIRPAAAAPARPAPSAQAPSSAEPHPQSSGSHEAIPAAGTGKTSAVRLAQLSADVSEAQRLLHGRGESRPGFEVVLEKPRLRFLRKRLSAYANQFLTEGTVDCTPAEFIHLWTDAAFRSEWDKGLFSLAPVEGDGALCHVIKYPYPLASRHYLYDRQLITLPGEITVLVCTSAAPRLAALGLSGACASPGSVLCSRFHSLTAVRPCREGAGGESEYVMLTLDEQPVPLPGWLLDSLLKRTYPAYMANVQQAVELLLSRRPPAAAPALQPLARTPEEACAEQGSAPTGAPPVPARARVPLPGGVLSVRNIIRSAAGARVNVSVAS